MQKESTARGELLEVFREELRELVNYKAGERLEFAKLTCLDVFFAYRMLLGRNPEFEDVARFREWQSVGTPAELFNQMIKTPEYVARIPGGGGQLLDLIVMHELPNGLRLFFNLQDRQAMRIATGIHEPEIIEAVRRVLKPGMNCVDAGAHIGMYALEMAKIVGAGGGKVYAFEPFPSTWELFIKNVAENHFEEVIVATKAGCHYDSGSAQIFNPISDDMGGAFIPKDAEIANASGLQGFRIELVRADSIVPDDRKIDLVKMDIEGSEPFALRGMERFIRRDRPIIITEFNPSCIRDMNKSEPQEYIALLRSFGYRLFEIDEYLKPSPREYRYDGGVNVTNLVCIALD